MEQEAARQRLERLIAQAGARASKIATGTGGPEPLDRKDLPTLPQPLLAVLQDLWRLSVAAAAPVDAPAYGESHPAWGAQVAELARRQCIARDGDAYRLTPLGLLSAQDAQAEEVVRIGERVRAFLAARYRDSTARRESILIGDLAHAIRVPLAGLQFALGPLSEALSVWCSQFTTPFTAESATLTPGERILEATSVSDVARQLAQRPVSARRAKTTAARSAEVPPAPAAPSAEVTPVPVGASSADREPATRPRGKRLKVFGMIAAAVILGAVAVWLAAALRSGGDTSTFIQPTPAKLPAVARPTVSDVNTQLNTDMTLPIDLCLVQQGSEPVVQCVREGACRGAGLKGLGFVIDKTSRAAAVASCQQACRAQAAARGIRCAAAPTP